MNRKMHLSKVKHSKFNESGQLLVFYLASAVWGADIILRVSLVTWGFGELWAEIIWKVGMLTMKQTASLLSVYLLENLTSQKGTLCSSIFPLLGTRRYFLWLLVTGLKLGEDGFSVQMNKNEYKLKSFINQFHFKKLPVMVSRNVNMRMWHGTWFHSCHSIPFPFCLMQEGYVTGISQLWEGYPKDHAAIPYVNVLLTIEWTQIA